MKTNPSDCSWDLQKSPFQPAPLGCYPSPSPPLSIRKFLGVPREPAPSQRKPEGSYKHRRRERGPIRQTRWQPPLRGCGCPPTQGGGLRHVTLPCLAPPPAAVPDGRQSSERRRRPFCACFLWDAVVAVGSEE
uniref:Uncharacterized protein n=1 Tax=Molossus molossus TaxID=27622 RepID=A0A7J8CZS8_MOLMO|nr:hypothetical protein HJG59_009514 [Molossus molossus]